MKRTHIVALAVFLLGMLSGVVEARSVGEAIFGSDAKSHQAPFNRLETALYYRDGLSQVEWPDPMVYFLQEADGVNSVLPDLSMPVPICDRPVFSITTGVIMSGRKIDKIFPAAFGAPIRTIIAPSNGWESGGSWLRHAIAQARRQARIDGNLCNEDLRRLSDVAEMELLRRGETGFDPGIFPPFIVLPLESKPKFNPNGSISFGTPQLSLQIAIVAPVSNQLIGAAHAISLFVSAGKNSYAGAVLGFKTTKPANVPQPTTYRDSDTESGCHLGSCPPEIHKWLPRYTFPEGQAWDEPCQYIRPCGGKAGLITFLVRGGKPVRGGARFNFNGQTYPEDEKSLVVMCPGSLEGTNRDIIWLNALPEGAEVKTEFYETDDEGYLVGLVATDEFTMGPADTVTYRPVIR